MRVEINLTLKCNLACSNCNRLCHIFRDRTDHITRQQMMYLLDDVKAYHQQTGRKVTRIKVAGGEPFLHPDYDWMLCRLAELVPEFCTKVKVDTNGTVPYETTADINFSGRSAKRKHHLPYLWSPTDMGLPITPCKTPFLCGFSLDNRGWLPCSPAIMIARCFGLEHLYRDRMPWEVWGLDELCKYCIHAAPQCFRDKYCKPLNEITQEEKLPTPSWKKALESYLEKMS